MKVAILPVKLRVPLKFGAESIDSLKVVHVELTVYGVVGRGETPLSAAWAWPSEISFSYREEMMCRFCGVLAEEYRVADADPMTAGYTFINEKLPAVLAAFNAENRCSMPYLAALICTSAFDIALHDAWGLAHDLPTYSTYNRKYMAHDLEWFFQDPAFAGLYPEDFFVDDVPDSLPVWHLVGGRDLLCNAEISGGEYFLSFTSTRLSVPISLLIEEIVPSGLATA